VQFHCKIAFYLPRSPLSLAHTECDCCDFWSAAANF